MAPNATQSFSALLADRVHGRSLEQLSFVELFAGTGGLSAAIRHVGLAAIGIDHVVAKRALAPVLHLDLSQEAGQALMWDMLARPGVVFVHLGPPCGTSSRARDIANGGPPPLRSDRFPDGRPSLAGTNRARVDTANLLYQLSGQVMAFCCRHGILCTIENPSRSFAWQTSHLQKPLQPWSPMLTSIHLHACMFGSQRRKATKLLANHPGFQRLGILCDNMHPHEPWGRVRSGWATALEVAYPPKLCRAWASACKEILLEHQALDITDLAAQQLPPNLGARAAVGTQPRGKRLKPAVREVKHVIRVTGPPDTVRLLPPRCKEDAPFPPQLQVQPSLTCLPAGARLLRTQMCPGDGARDIMEATYGIPWEPEEFIAQAVQMGHPAHFVDSVPKVLRDAIHEITSNSLGTMASHRTEAMRKWMARAVETREEEARAMLTAPEHCRKILGRKNLTVFREMLEEVGYDDTTLCSDIRRGFDLMGDLHGPDSFPRKVSYATLRPEEVRSAAKDTRKAIALSALSSRDKDLDKELYDITLDEVKRGWLDGPFELDALPPDATVSRRFGVKQGSTLADGTRAVKVRPIDDLSESLINLTNGGEVTIAPMGVDAILAALVLRMRSKTCVKLRAKTIDLRKAYKNLPVSLDALRDSHLMVFDPLSGRPQVFRSRVLVFGARASVMGFCRTAAGIWSIGAGLFHLHWTSYFDDFFLVCEEGEERHIDLAQRLLFQLLGWETSTEKEAEFHELARVLGIEIDLASASVGILMAKNGASRVVEIGGQIDSILSRGRYSRGELKVLRGRLQFAEQQVYGRSSAWMVQILSHAAEASPSGRTTPELERALRFLKHRLETAGPREVSAKEGSTWFLFTDACLETTGGLGGILYNHQGSVHSWYSQEVPPSLCQDLNPDAKRTIISELEALAVLAGLECLCGHLSSKCEDRLVVFIDNEAALGSLISGKASTRVTRSIVDLVAEWEFARCPGLWFERVPSHSNPADGPSRSACTGLDPLCNQRLHLDALVGRVVAHCVEGPRSS